MSPRKGANKSLPPKHKPMAEKHRRELSKPSRNTSDFQERSVLLRNLRSVAGELSLSMSETSTECDDRESTRESIRMDEMQSKPVEIPPTDRSVLLALGLPLALGSGRAPADRAPRGSSRPTGDACYEPADEPKAHSWRARPHEGSHGDVAAALLSPSGCEAFSPDHGTEERVDETAGGSGVPAVAVAAAAAEEEEERGGREERPATEGLPPAGDALVRAVIFRGRVGLREFDSPEAAAAEEPRAQPRASPSATERRPHTAVPSGAARVSASRRMETEPPRPMVRGRGFRGALPPLLSSRFGDPTTAERFDRPMTAPAPGQSRQGRPSHVRLDPCARLFRIVEDMGKHWPLLQDMISESKKAATGVHQRLELPPEAKTMKGALANLQKDVLGPVNAEKVGNDIGRLLLGLTKDQRNILYTGTASFGFYPLLRFLQQSHTTAECLQKDRQLRRMALLHYRRISTRKKPLGSGRQPGFPPPCLDAPDLTPTGIF